MALETATFIDGLVPENPTGTDPKSQGDDHLRLIKSTVLNTFPNITGEVTATHEDLSGIAGGNAALLDASNEFSDAVPIVGTHPDNTIIRRDDDAGFVRILGGSAAPTTNGAALFLFGEGHATDPGDVTLRCGDSGEMFLQGDAINIGGVPSTDFARLSQTNTFEARQEIRANFFTLFNMERTGQAVDTAYKHQINSGGNYQWRVSDSADSDGDVFFFVERTGLTVDRVNFPAGELQYGGDEVGFRRLVNIQNGNYTLQASDAGHGVAKHSGGAGETWTIPDGTFQTGDPVPLFVLSGPLTVSPGAGVTLIHMGTGNTGSVTIEPPGQALLYFPGPSACYIGGIGVIST